MRSDRSPHNRRPTPLQSELTAMSVAPYSASTSGSNDESARPQTSCNSGDWKLMTEMPAAMLKKKTIHMMANSGDVRHAFTGGAASDSGCGTDASRLFLFSSGFRWIEIGGGRP